MPGRSTRLAQQKLGRIAGRSVLRPSLLNALTTVALGTTALLLGGCGTGQVGGSTDGDAVKVRYESVHEGGESGGTPVLVEVIAAGEKFRMSTADAATPDEVYLTVVWDGDAMLLLEGQEASRQVDPPQEERPTAFILQAGDATFELLCPGGEQDGSAEVAGRAGTVYSCPASNTDGMAGESSQLTLDDATGVLLSRVSASSRMVAVDVDPDVDVDDATFSTEIPPEMRSEGQGGDDGASPLPLTATDGVPLAGGGQLLMEQIRQGPSLVVIGELPGVTAMLAHILPRTDQGTAPPVYVLLNPLPFDEADSSDLPLASAEGEQKLLADVSAQVSDVPVPVGIDIKGGAAGEDLRPFEELMSGTTVLAAIDETGALAWRMTDTELTDSPDQLDDWIAFTT
ncbi:MAG TPA: hypothetical protein VLA55_05000 [Ornithinibacter sp.]|nr:hypothetical protein [Ornithinibacter sp.]